MKHARRCWPIAITLCVLFLSCLMWYKVKDYGAKMSQDFRLRERPRENRTDGDGKDKKEVVFVLILAHYRSGSTYLSEVFNSNPEAFFVFEPILGIEKKLQTEKYAASVGEHWNSTKTQKGVHKISKSSWNSSVTLVLENIFRCRLNELPDEVIRSQFMMTKSRRHEGYSKCVAQNMEDCITLLTKICLASKIRTIKVIRLHGKNDILMYLMRTYPNLRLLKLVRDPRGIIVSRKRLGKRNKSYEQLSVHLCREMELDICNYIDVFESYPGRVMKIVYEDMAENPYQSIEDIYSFLHQPIQEDMVRAVLAMSSAKSEGWVYGTDRSDSTRTAYAWKWRLTPDSTRRIDGLCTVVYHYAGYCRLRHDRQLWNHKDKLRVRGGGISAKEACMKNAGSHI
ncbi:hypothetical protein ScPMuIL_015340 [Solemya velum]